MAKHIQAYFKSEDEAEGARASLLPYETEQMEVGALDASIGRNGDLLVPLVPINGGLGNGGAGTASVAGMPGTASAQGVVPVVTEHDNSDENGTVSDELPDRTREDGVPDPLINVSAFSDEDYDNLRYVLSLKVKDEDYEMIVHKLRGRGAFVDRLD